MRFPAGVDIICTNNIYKAICVKCKFVMSTKSGQALIESVKDHMETHDDEQTKDA